MAQPRTIYADDRQTMNDIALMYYGTIEAVAGICWANGFDINYQPYANQAIILPDTMPDGEAMPVNTRVRDYFQSNNIKPANNYLDSFFNNTNPWLWPDGAPILIGGPNEGWWLIS